MVADRQNESFADFLAKVVEKRISPVVKCLLDGSVDVRVVPDEVIGNARSELGSVIEDWEEVSEFYEIFGDSTAVVNCRGEILEEFSNVHNTEADACGSTLLEVSNSVFNINDEWVSAVHTSEQVCEVVFMDNSIHEASENVDDINGAEGLYLLKAHHGNANGDQTLFKHHF